MEFVPQTERLFHELRTRLFQDLQQGEDLALSLSAEDSLFVRFNRSLVRQNTEVEQRHLTMNLQKNSRSLQLTFDLSGQLDADFALARSILNRARQEIEHLPESSALAPLTNQGSSHHLIEKPDLSFKEMLEALKETTSEVDLAGLLASGPMIEANANSQGQVHWFAAPSFFFDYSIFTVNDDHENKAVKGVYSNSTWSTSEFLQQLNQSKAHIPLLKKRCRTLKPGDYRVFLTAAATSKLINMFSRGALSYASFRKGASAFSRLAEGQERFSTLFSLRENFALNLTPRFNRLGETPPTLVPLIEKGELKQFLVSSPTAQQFKVESNFAEINMWGSESMRSAEVLPGKLDEQCALAELGTGLYLGNLHYLNWSDRVSAKVTGMTRYACYWVENGEIQAPIHDLRFDESLYSMFGKNLIALTRQQHLDPEIGTYEKRSFGGKLVPGMLVDRFQFTL